MRIFFLGNNLTGLRILEYLRGQGEEICAMAVHPPGRSKFGDEITRASGLPPGRIFDGSQLRTEQAINSIRELKPDIAVSAFFGYVLRPDLISTMRYGCINIHPAYLPFNRGAHPNVWCMLDGTPAGVTIHYIDEGIDSGDIIAQRKVEVDPADTGGSLYAKLERECLRLFEESWPAIRKGEAPRLPQRPGEGTFHRLSDLRKTDEIDPEKTYKGSDLINLIRARTYPPYAGAYFRRGGKKIYLRLILEEETHHG